MEKGRVYVITMGCAKNLVDSEKLMAQLALNGIELAPGLEEAQVAVINTCGFIDAAKRESIDMMIAQVKRKGRGRLRKVYAMGCLTERYMADLKNEIPEIDGFFGSGAIGELVDELGGNLRTELLGERMLTEPAHVAYLKISEGCDNPCSFCAIPLMRGGYAGRPEAEILSEARRLAERGVRELVVIGQDTTFGIDNSGRKTIPALLAKLADIDGIEWVRLMYAYPAKFPTELLDVIAGHPHICKYLDIPIQHASDPVLKSMRRGTTRRALRSLIDSIRERTPTIAIRTTVIVGYPAEGEGEFNDLLDFVRSVRFERLGVFTYSREEGTAAFELGDPVSTREKERRRALVMETQRGISEERNTRLIGTRLKVLIDRVEDGVYVGRSEFDAPEIDNEVFIRSERQLVVGHFYGVDIDDASEYDLYGTV